MSTENRVIADRLYRCLEGMLFIAVSKLGDSPRRDANNLDFIDIIEDLLDAKRSSGKGE